MASMTSSPLPKRKRNTRNMRHGLRRRVFPRISRQITAQEQLEIEQNVTNSALQALRLSVRQYCRMHFDLTSGGTKGNLSERSKPFAKTPMYEGLESYEEEGNRGTSHSDQQSDCGERVCLLAARMEQSDLLRSVVDRN